jgi:hypothetical protein
VDDSWVGGGGGVVGLDHPYKNNFRLSSKGDRYYSVLVFFQIIHVGFSSYRQKNTSLFLGDYWVLLLASKKGLAVPHRVPPNVLNEV